MGLKKFSVHTPLPKYERVPHPGASLLDPRSSLIQGDHHERSGEAVKHESLFPLPIAIQYNISKSQLPKLLLDYHRKNKHED